MNTNVDDLLESESDEDKEIFRFGRSLSRSNPPTPEQIAAAEVLAGPLRPSTESGVASRIDLFNNDDDDDSMNEDDDEPPQGTAAEGVQPPGGATADSSSNRCATFFESKGRDPRVLLAMAIGLPPELGLVSHDDDTFTKSSAYREQMKPNSTVLKQEVLRRYRAYVHEPERSTKKKVGPRPQHWTIKALNEYLEKNPIPHVTFVAEITWLRAALLRHKQHVATMPRSGERRSVEEVVISRHWNSRFPFLRLYHVLIHDDIRSSLVTAFSSMNRQELDGRNSGLYPTFFEQAASKFNDESWVPTSLVLPDLHDEFKESHRLELCVDKITAEQFKDRLRKQRAKLLVIESKYRQTGAGSGIPREHQPGQGLDFTNAGSKRKDYLGGESPHLLYLWHIGELYEIFDSIKQYLKEDSGVDGNSAPSVESVRRKRKSAGSDDREQLVKGVNALSGDIGRLVNVADESTKAHVSAHLYTYHNDLARNLAREIEDLDDELAGDITHEKKTRLQRKRENRLAELAQAKSELNANRSAVHSVMVPTAGAAASAGASSSASAGGVGVGPHRSISVTATEDASSVTSVE